MKRILFIVFVSFFCTVGLRAQQNLSEEKSKQLQQLYLQLDGTYQIQMVNTRALSVFQLILLNTIDSVRSQRDTVYISVNSIERIMVLPKQVINRSGFIKPEHIKYITQ